MRERPGCVGPPTAAISPLAELPHGPGTYILVLRLSAAVRLVVGGLGALPFPAGYYTYTGSARGPGGLRGRVGRHLRRTKRLHWHIDYLLGAAEVLEVWCAPLPQRQGRERRECAWAALCAGLPGMCAFLAPLGASDCRCRTHLAFGEAPPDAEAFARAASVELLRFNPLHSPARP